MVRLFSLLFCLVLPAFGASGALTPDRWVPARWEGGPLELARRAALKTPPPAEDAAVREALAGWYSPSTLELLEGTPVNCLLVTFSAAGDPAIEQQQHSLLRDYASAAKARGISILGIVHPGRDAASVAAGASRVRLDGLVLEAGFPDASSFARKLRESLQAGGNPVPVVAIEKEPFEARKTTAAVAAVTGVRPGARDLADMGVRSGPSAEPWIESNIWLVRSLRAADPSKPVWIHQEADAGSPGDYLRCVADAAMAGGRWIVSLDDKLRAGMYRKSPESLAAWRSMAGYMTFAGTHRDWEAFAPYGLVAVIIDASGANPEFADEYLNLVARRHIPYRILFRSAMTEKVLSGFQVVLAADVSRPTDAERIVLRNFAEQGGVLITGPSWGGAPKDEEYAGVPAGKGRVIVYKDDPPDPETVARDMVDLLEPESMGLTLFNVPSVLAYVSSSPDGRLVQLLNYATMPFPGKVTVRIKGTFKRARLLTPEGQPSELQLRVRANAWTEFAVPGLTVWAAVLLE
jgi:hypothetical protein